MGNTGSRFVLVRHNDLRELFESHKIVDLKLFAKQAGIKGGDQMNKADLIEALVGSGYKPDDGE